MATWYKDGVMGKLNSEAARGLCKVKALYAKKNEELFITSLQEGTHSPGSLHPSGDAWDQRPGKVTIEEIKSALGPSFDVINETDHYHCEYDPK